MANGERPDSPGKVPPDPMEDLPLFTRLESDAPEETENGGGEQPVEEASSSAAAGGEPIEWPATLTSRLGAALLDLGVMAAAGVALLIGSALLGARVSLDDWPAYVLPWVAFSFVYYVFPLSFWGRTPGMASMNLRARDLGGGPISFGQAFSRWLATLLTTGLVGLPGLLSLSGRSTTDRLSGSVTLWRGQRKIPPPKEP